MMKRFCLLILFLFSSVQLFSQENVKIKILEGKVSYLSSQYIYVQFENTNGLEVSDTLYEKIKGNYIPILKVESFSSRSCATTSFGKDIKKGNNIYGIVKVHNRNENIKPTVMQEIETENQMSTLVKVDTTEYIGFKKMDKQIYGRFSISSYSNLSNISSRTDYQNWRYSFSFNANNIDESKMSFSNYITFRYRADDWHNVTNNIEDALRIYDLSIRYDVSSSTNILLGRKINRKIANIGAVDGIQLETKINNFTLGGVLGSRPDYNNYGYNFDLLQFGGYINRTDSLGKGEMQNTIGVMQQMNDMATDRRFIYFQHNNNIFDKTNLFLSSELDLFENVNNKAKNDLKFTSLFLSLRYSPIRWLSTSLSYDARKNVIYYETFKNYADQLAESALRQGFRLRVNIRPINKVFANVYMGYRYRDDDIRPSRNFGGGITHSRIPFLNLSLSVNTIILKTNYLDGTIWGARLSKDLFDGIVSTSIGYKNVDYTFLNSNSQLLQDIVQLDLSYRINKKLSLSINFEGTYEDKLSYSNIYANFTTRF